ncbi:hypothetical protein QBC33DRAFT_622594 [Phialemonium atrogriseum]|uniref:F-box domain-containing protein n=1 Tax=Phialemonium atrogriseum TaxID=1093897 RepID=A0AAJ0BTA3_9PEZI|nr:uncharacterized protein QBC33DRAFT_622594 [Phialemonium atrogriseum]KAK1763885.1 hypothetical protein QBC33DRAFT_622594 [Phialemonium atrogriseum]
MDHSWRTAIKTLVAKPRATRDTSSSPACTDSALLTQTKSPKRNRFGDLLAKLCRLWHTSFNCGAVSCPLDNTEEEAGEEETRGGGDIVTRTQLPDDEPDWVAGRRHNLTISPLCRLPNELLLMIMAYLLPGDVFILCHASAIYIPLLPRPVLKMLNNPWMRILNHRALFPTHGNGISFARLDEAETARVHDLLRGEFFCKRCLERQRQGLLKERLSQLQTFLYCSGCNSGRRAFLFPAHQRQEHTEKPRLYRSNRPLGSSPAPPSAIIERGYCGGATDHVFLHVSSTVPLFDITNPRRHPFTRRELEAAHRQATASPLFGCGFCPHVNPAHGGDSDKLLRPFRPDNCACFPMPIPIPIPHPDHHFPSICCVCRAQSRPEERSGRFLYSPFDNHSFHCRTCNSFYHWRRHGSQVSVCFQGSKALWSPISSDWLLSLAPDSLGSAGPEGFGEDLWCENKRCFTNKRWESLVKNHQYYVVPEWGATASRFVRWSLATWRM